MTNRSTNSLFFTLFSSLFLFSSEIIVHQCEIMGYGTKNWKFYTLPPHFTIVNGVVRKRLSLAVTFGGIWGHLVVFSGIWWKFV
jgi:hypothetical protein